MNIVEQKKSFIESLCEKHNVISLDLVGSFANESFNDESDVDFLVTFGDVAIDNFANNYYDFVSALEELLNRKVDLISEKKISNPYLLKSFNRNRIKIYERRDTRLAA